MKNVSLILVSVFLVFAGSTASYGQGNFIAKRLPGYSLNDNHYAAIGRSTFLFGTTTRAPSGASAVMSVTSYSLASGASEVVFEDSFFATDDPGAATPEIQLLAAGSKVFAVVNGKLVVSNGRKSGTRMLADFRVYYCCGIGDYFSRVRFLNSEGGIVYFEVVEDVFGFFPRRAPSRVRLWRSDGTSSGTYPLSSSHSLDETNLGGHIRTIGSFIAKVNGENTVFYFLTYAGRKALWKVSEVGQSELVYRFSDRIALPEKVTQTRRGTYFCTGNRFHQGSAGHLWRISNAGRLQALANGCWVDSALSLGDSIYYTNFRGVWLTDGTFGGEQRVFSVSLSTSSSCTIGNTVYMVVIREFDFNTVPYAKLLKIDGTAVTDIASTAPQGNIGQRASVSSCDSRGFSVRSFLHDDTSRFFQNFFNSETQKVSAVNGLVEARRSLFAAAAPLREAIRVNEGILVLGDNYPYLLTPNRGYIPSIIELLLNEPVSTALP